MSNPISDLFTNVAVQFVGRLPEESIHRVAALAAVRGIMPDADTGDRMVLANYILTGFEIIPEPKDDPYPHASGDITVLGPQIFASTTVPAENTVINWRGENFVPQRDAFPHERPAESEPPDPPSFDEHPNDPGPAEPVGLPDDLDFDPSEPAPMAGTHWQGHRGGQSR